MYPNQIPSWGRLRRLFCSPQELVGIAYEAQLAMAEAESQFGEHANAKKLCRQSFQIQALQDGAEMPV